MIEFDKRKWEGGNAFPEDEEEWRRKKVLEDLAESKTNYFYLGAHLLDIWNTKTYGMHTFDSVSNFSPKNFFDYCFVYFGLEKSQVSRYMNIVDEFGNGLRGFKEEFLPYKYSALSEMLSLTPEQRKEVSPEWTIKQIRDYKRKLAGVVATSQQEKEPYTKIYGKLDSTFASGRSKEFLKIERDRESDDKLEESCSEVSKKAFVGFDYYNFSAAKKADIIYGLLAFAQDMSEKISKSTVNFNSAYFSLKELGYIE